MNGTQIHLMDQSSQCVLGEQTLPSPGRDSPPSGKQIETLLQKIWPKRPKESDNSDVPKVDSRTTTNSSGEHSQRNSMHLQTNVRLVESSSCSTNQGRQDSDTRESNTHILRRRIGPNSPLVYPTTRNKGPSSFCRLLTYCSNLSNETRRDCTSKVGELELRGENVQSDADQDEGSKILVRDQERGHRNRGMEKRVCGWSTNGVGYSITGLTRATRFPWSNGYKSKEARKENLGHRPIQHQDIPIYSGEASHRIWRNVRRCSCYSWSQVHRDNAAILPPNQDESQSEVCT